MSEYTVEVNLPNVPEGADVEIYGLGSFKNGGTYGISDELVGNYRLENVVKDPNHPNFDRDPMSLLNPHEGISIYPSNNPPNKGNTRNKSEEREAS